MRITKKLLSLLLAIVMLFSITAGIDLSAYASTYWEKESNDSFFSANTLPVNSSISGNFLNWNEDYYKITVNQNGKLNLKFVHDKIDSSYYWSVSVYKEENGKYKNVTAWKTIATIDQDYVFPTIGVTKGSTYYIEVSVSNYEIDYLNYTLTNTFTNTENYEKEFNNSFFSANTLNINSSITGNFVEWNSDYYKIPVSKNAKLSVKFSHDKADTNYSWNVNIYKKSGNDYNKITGKNIRTIDADYTFDTLNVTSGDYYIKISVSNYCIENLEYKLTVTDVGTLKAPTLKATVNSNGTFKLSWNKVTGADKYELYIKQVDGSYKLMKTTTSTSFTTAFATYGKQFSYKMRAVTSKNKSAASAYSSVVNAKNTKKLQTPSLKVAVNKNGSFKLSWGKVTGATSYQIYMKQSNGTYKLIKTTTSTSFTTAVASKGKTYSYKVRAVTSKNKNATSDYSKVVSAKRK